MKSLQRILVLAAVAGVLTARRVPHKEHDLKTNLALHPFFQPNPPPMDQGDPQPTDITFYLCTRANRDGVPIRYTDESVHANFDGTKRTFAVIHGFGGGVDTLPWTHQVMNGLLDKVDGNVILVDWGILSAQPWYYSAAGNVHYVGQELGALLTDLTKRTPLTPSNVHLIGFSLGGQVCGVTANHFGPIDRITGLDPAAPAFDGKSKDKRLDKGDATFVDVIHTNSGHLVTGHLSVYDAIGHVDFYPNGGQDQRGCPTLEGEAIGSIVSSDEVEACSHGRSIKYFIASLTEDYFVGYKCKSYEKFQEALCVKDSNKLGYDVYRYNEGKFYMETLVDKPYAARQHKVDFHLASHSSGSMVARVKVPGMDADEFELFGGVWNVNDGDVVTLVLPSPGAGITEMELELEFEDGWVGVETFKISYIESYELGTFTIGCFGANIEVPDKTKVTLSARYGAC